MDTALGRLIGQWTDSNYSASNGVNAGWMEWLQRSDGTYDMVYYKPSTDDLRVIDDFHGGSPADSSLVDLGSTARTVTMQKHNNVLHIGTGTSAEAKWVGEIDFGQFGATPSTATLHCLDAELEPPETFPMMYKVVGSGREDFQGNIMTALQRLEVGATEGGNEILGVENLVPRHKVKELLAVRRFCQTVLRTIVEGIAEV